MSELSLPNETPEDRDDLVWGVEYVWAHAERDDLGVKRPLYREKTDAEVAIEELRSELSEEQREYDTTYKLRAFQLE